MPRLIGSYQAIPTISKTTLDEFYALFNRHYDHVSFEKFKADFVEKDYVIVLRDREQNRLRGFSTLVLYERMVKNTPIKLIFSGDTIVEKKCWGEQELMKTWCSMVGAIKAEFDHIKLYWLLISKGYRTYLYLPLFCKEFYPRHNASIPIFEQEIIQDFASFKFGSYFNHERGLVSFDESQGQLRADLAEVPSHRAENPHVRFFLEKNRDYRRGDELVCLAELDSENLRGAAKRHFDYGFREYIEARKARFRLVEAAS
jgi:hypothetical protein